MGLAQAPTPAVPERSSTESEGEDRLLSFSTPLMLNVMLWWSTPLIITSVLARTPEPDCSLAAFTVVEAVAWFLVLSPYLGWQILRLTALGWRLVGGPQNDGGTKPA